MTRDDAYYERLSAAVEAHEYTVSGPIEYGQPAPHHGGVGEHREDSSMTTAIDSLTIFLPAPSAERLATALAAITAAELTTVPAVVSDSPGQVHTMHLDGTRIQVVEGAAPAAAAPEQIALQVSDPDAAVDRLTDAEFTVETVPGDDRVAGSLSVSGVRLLIVTAA